MPATEELRYLMAAIVAELPAREGYHPERSATSAATPVATQDVRWLPRSRYPANLFLAYTGQRERVTVAAWDDAGYDLSALSLPPGLGLVAFGHYVGALLLQHPTIRHLDLIAREGHRFGRARALLRMDPDAAGSDRAPDELLQTFMRWLTYFLPDQYEITVGRYSESLRRR